MDTEESGNRSIDELIDDSALERSSVVANSTMNRERGLVGVNSYAKDLGVNPYAFLRERLQTEKQVAWLDLCCGSGKALIEAAQVFEASHLSARVRLHGVDLIPMFYPNAATWEFLTLEEASLSNWEPSEAFDLITCVHGLHYIGDKLHLLQNACSWLRRDGLFVSHLDFSNVKLASGKSSAVVLGKDLRRAGLEYKPKAHLLSCRGRKRFYLPYRYLGADDTAGPNYTGQPAVNSYYEAQS